MRATAGRLKGSGQRRTIDCCVGDGLCVARCNRPRQLGSKTAGSQLTASGAGCGPSQSALGLTGIGVYPYGGASSFPIYRFGAPAWQSRPELQVPHIALPERSLPWMSVKCCGWVASYFRLVERVL